MIRLARARKFRARWTKRIHEEWVGALLRERTDLDEYRLLGVVDKLNNAVPDCLVYNYESLIDDLVLPDDNDRHVLAAAIRAGAQCIVTMNLKDFPPAALEPFDIFARHPDDFVLDLADLEPEVLLTAAKEQRASLKSPPYTAEEFIERLRRQNLPNVAAFLESWAHLI